MGSNASVCLKLIHKLLQSSQGACIIVCNANGTSSRHKLHCEVQQQWRTSVGLLFKASTVLIIPKDFCKSPRSNMLWLFAST